MAIIKQNPLRRLHSINRNVGIATTTESDVQCPHFRNRFIKIGTSDVTDDYMAECHFNGDVECEYRQKLDKIALCKRYWKEELKPASFLYQDVYDGKEPWQNLKVQINYERPFVERTATVQIAMMQPKLTPIDLGNFLATWREWSENERGNWGYQIVNGQQEILNRNNQNGRSFWYNPTHMNFTNYAIEFYVQARGGDDDMYGAVFRYNSNGDFYSFEWDSGGMGINGMAIYRNVRTSSGYVKTRLAYNKTLWGANRHYIHKVSIRMVNNKINVKVYRKSGSTFNQIASMEVLDLDPTAILEGAWGPVTSSQPNTYFWGLSVTNYELISGTEKYPTEKVIPLSYRNFTGGLHVVSGNVKSYFEETINALGADSETEIEYWIIDTNVYEGVQFSLFDTIPNSTSNSNSAIAMTTFEYDKAILPFIDTQVTYDRTNTIHITDFIKPDKSIASIEIWTEHLRIFDSIIFGVNGVSVKYIPNIVDHYTRIEFNPWIKLENGDTAFFKYTPTEHELSYYHGPAIDTHDKVWRIKDGILGWHKKAERE